MPGSSLALGRRPTNFWLMVSASIAPPLYSSDIIRGRASLQLGKAVSCTYRRQGEALASLVTVPISISWIRSSGILS